MRLVVFNFKFLALSLVLPIVCASPLLRADELTDRVDALFAPYDRPDSPGVSLGVIRDGEFVYKRGYGSANLDREVPLDSESVFYIASTSKQFTAACVALASLDGDLSLDDDIRKYVPEVPDYGKTITIRHLLHHTSGLRDYLNLLAAAGRGEGGRVDRFALNSSRARNLAFERNESKS